ncbi:MAG: MarR family transcriptional regulator [Subtercola sp.]|nr:MarR family transcriptional regulator [Subtercola sp.]
MKIMSDPQALSTSDWRFWDTWMQAQRLLMREVDRVLQRDFGVSKAEFSVLVTLQSASDGARRVTELADALDWDKSRVAHLLTRMEKRGLVERSESGAAGRRTGIALTETGRNVAERAIIGHGKTIRRLAIDRLSPEQAAAITAWSRALLADQTLSESGGRSNTSAD